MLDFALIRRYLLLMVCLVCIDADASLSADDAKEIRSPEIPLHDRVDTLVEQEAIGILAPLCSDADFLRRIHLDLTGTIPSGEQVRKFLDDSSPQKRQTTIDQLIVSAEFTRHMAVLFDIMLLERRSDKSIAVKDWENFLIDSIAANKPLDQLFQEIVFAEGDQTPLRAATKFILNRDAEPNAVTRDVGRIAFGMDLQCAQCHNHPLVEDYLQEEYYGLYAYWHRIRLFTDPKTKALVLSEVADGEASFKSVFTGDASDSALPRVPAGKVLVDEPTLAGDDAYLVKPSKDKPSKPKFSRRHSLAKSLSSNPQFRRNIANRLWLVMFGRGIVHPIDLHHTDNPPTNPALLQVLADELASQGFQLRPFIRELAMTRAYQRACDVPDPITVNFGDIAARKALLVLEQERLATNVATLEAQSKDKKLAYDAMIRRHENAVSKIPALTKKALESEKKLTELAKLSTSDAMNAEKLKEQVAAVLKASEATDNALAQLPEDTALKEIASKFKTHVTELSSAFALAEKKQIESSAKKTEGERELSKTHAALQEAMGERIHRDTFEPLENDYLAIANEHEAAVYQLKSVEQKLSICQMAEDFASLRNTQPEKAEAAWQSLVQVWTQRNQIAPLKPLTPEQLAISTMRATGSLELRIESAASKLKKSPPAALKNADTASKNKMEKQLMQGMLLDELRGTVNQFVGLYGGLLGDDFQATVNQALFFGNGTVVDGFIKPANNNLIQRLVKIDDPIQIADELYFAILSRAPSEIERTEIVTLVSTSGEKKADCISELSWALLSSNEFRFNH